ncbi:MAG: DUF433 domain-containing protein [Pirellulales bacterium]
MNSIIVSRPDLMHGTACFAGTRVAVDSFFDHLEAGYSIAGFLIEFSTVSRGQVIALLSLLRKDLERLAVSV